MEQGENKMEKIVSLAKRRGFVFAGSEIYGGLANTWDYGPLGVALKNNIKKEWWSRFVERRADIIGIESALLMNTGVWQASGHLTNFSDPLVEDKITHERYRLDHLLKEAGVSVSGLSYKEMVEQAKNKDLKSPEGNDLTEPKQFNLMFKTSIGPVADEGSEVYLRPETAQGMFVNFKNVLQATRKKLPFGIAQMGKSFRNEITPGNFIFRTREFEQIEIEYFINPPEKDSDWEKPFGEWQEEMKVWIEDLGIKEEEIVEFEVPDGERAHYSKRTIDFEYKFPFGQKELYGLAYRTDFDLANHGRESGEELVYTDEEGKKMVPHVIEPSFGVERTFLAVLSSAYTEELAPTGDEGVEMRVVLKLPEWLAPIKVAVLPLSKKPELMKVAEPILAELLKAGIIAEMDVTQSIGKRYRRQDEIGTPYCVTIDFESLEDKQITVRERDSMKQERIKIGNLVDYMKNKLEE